MLYFEQSCVVYLVTISLFQHFSNSMKHWMDVELTMIATPKNWLKAQLGYGFGAQFRPWHSGAFPELGRHNLLPPLTPAPSRS